MLKKIINVNGEPFLLNKIKNKSLSPDIQYWKEATGSDSIVEDASNYYFISSIEEAVVVSDPVKLIETTSSTSI